jgi:hypothetical protein
MPEFFAVKVVKGRKDHKCCECFAVLPKGADHECANGKWEDSVATYRTCLDCVALRDRIDDGDGYVFGGLSDPLSYGDFDECDDVQAFRERCDSTQTPTEGKR